MLKKLGLVTLGVTAGLVAAAPLASAQTCSFDGNPDNQGVVGQCSTLNQNNGHGNTLNGEEIPAPDASAVTDLVGGLLELPSVPVPQAPSDPISV